MHLISVGLKKRENLARMPLASSTLFHLLLCLVSAAFIPGCTDVPVLLAEVTPAQEAATTTEATHTMAVLATESSDQEDPVVRDNAALHVRDVED
jgi:hypothetical protein